MHKKTRIHIAHSRFVHSGKKIQNNSKVNQQIYQYINSLVYSDQEILYMKRNNYRYSQHGCISTRKIWIEISHCVLKDI